MVKKLPQFQVNEWLVDASVQRVLYERLSTTYNVHVTCEHGNQLFQFLFHVTVGPWDKQGVTVGPSVVIICSFLVPLLAINVSLWYSETDLPLLRFRILKGVKAYNVEYAGITCDCYPCVFCDAVVKRNRKSLKEFCYGTETDVHSPTDEDKHFSDSE